MLTTLEDRRVGLEQEFFLVDEDGVLSNRADEFLTRCREAAVAAGRDPGSYAPECARSMVEINTPPVYDPRRALTRVPGEPRGGPGRGAGLGSPALPTRDLPPGRGAKLARRAPLPAPGKRGRAREVRQRRPLRRGPPAPRGGGRHDRCPSRGLLRLHAGRAGGVAEPLQPGYGLRRGAHSPHPLVPLLRGHQRRAGGAHRPLPRRPGTRPHGLYARSRP
jgi:hypothetical protein